MKRTTLPRQCATAPTERLPYFVATATLRAENPPAVELEPGIFGEGAHLTAPGAGGAIINAELYSTADDPLDTEEPEITVAVWSDAYVDVNLDLPGLDQFIADVDQLKAKLVVLRGKLAAAQASK